MPRFPYILFILTVLLSRCSEAQTTHLQLLGKGKQPKLMWVGHKIDNKIILEFQRLFLEATNHKIEMIGQNDEKETIICLKIDENKSNQFRIFKQNNEIIIEGSNSETLGQGIHYFFLNYVRYYPFKKTSKRIKEISVPVSLNYSQKVSFEYREPYFQQNYHAELSNFNQTNQLEETWGIWGHQIMKLVSESTDIFAEVKGQKTKEQLCFSSKSLEKEIVKTIEEKNKNNLNLVKFMIMPADNSIVCQCEMCIKNGNTNTNASPAVFKLINKLAKKFPKFQLFSTSYISTESAPSFKLEKNAGVMLSTMSFPKGVLYEKTNKKDQIEKKLKSWKAVTNTIYVWDYGIHFDQYFSSYPSLLIHQKNIQIFKNQGVTGFFMQGNEESYAAFEDLKYFVYAQLLLNPDSDVRGLIRFFLEGQYPNSGTLLADYYLEIEEKSFNSKIEMDIYGGWNSQLKKYLNYPELLQLIQNLNALESTTSDSELVALKPIKLALNYQLLEIMRINGFGNGGYASINSEGALTINKESKQAFENIQKLKKETKIDLLNESHSLLINYLDLWNSEIFKKELKFYVQDLKLKANSKLDEGYTDLNVLINGKVGFYDYDNNWLITSVEPLNLNVDYISEVDYFSVSFLQDTKHRIYFPQKVHLTIGKEIYMAEIPNNVLNKSLTKYTIEIPLKKVKITDPINFKVIKQADFADKSNACGELQFTKR